MRNWLRWTLFVVAASIVNVELRAQQRFTSSTALLTLDVSVLDSGGNPVTGLTAEDFVVTLDDAAQPVRAMVFLATQNTTNRVNQRSASATAPSLLASAAPGSTSEPDPKLIVILVDDLSVYPADSKGLFVAAERFVGTIDPRDWVGLASTSDRMTVSPSLDRTRLQAKLKSAFGWMTDPRRESSPYIGLMDALEVDDGSQAAFRNALEGSCGLTAKLIGGMNMGEILAKYDCAGDVQRQARYTAEFARHNTQNQLGKYVAVIKAMASAPGVKQLVILTGGVALKPSESRHFIPVAQAAAAAGVQMTILMEEPDDADMSVRMARDLAKDQRRMMQQAQTLAEVSGGQFFRVVGQADRFYQRVLTSASAIYRIGVDLPAIVPENGNYQVAVTVNRPNVRVLASRYAVPPPPTVSRSPEEQMRHAITTGEPSYAVSVQMEAEVVRGDAGSPTTIRVRIVVAGHLPGPVSGIFGIVGPDQMLKSGRRDLVRTADGKTYHLDLVVPAGPGTHELRFATADASGAVGAVTQRVVVK